MTRHRRITGAVAVALLVIVATAAHWSSTGQTKSLFSNPTFDERWTRDVSTLPGRADDRSAVFSEWAKAQNGSLSQ